MAGGVESHWEPQTQAQRSPSTSTLGKTSPKDHSGWPLQRWAEGEQGRPMWTTPTAKHRQQNVLWLPTGLPHGMTRPSETQPGEPRVAGSEASHICRQPACLCGAWCWEPRRARYVQGPFCELQSLRKVWGTFGHSRASVHSGVTLSENELCCRGLSRAIRRGPRAASPFPSTGACAQVSVPSTLQPALTWDLTYVPHGLILAALCSILFI